MVSVFNKTLLAATSPYYVMDSSSLGKMGSSKGVLLQNNFNSII